jgi:hypothetical protein
MISLTPFEKSTRGIEVDGPPPLRGRAVASSSLHATTHARNHTLLLGDNGSAPVRVAGLGLSFGMGRLPPDIDSPSRSG